MHRNHSSREISACCVCLSRESLPFIAKPPYEIVVCQGCGLRYLSPQPSPGQLEELYSSEYFTSGDAKLKGYGDYVRDADNLRSTFRDRIGLLPSGAGRRILDVGAATGFFVEQARMAGWDAIGIEPSDWAATYARDVLGQPVQTGTLNGSTFAPDDFDIVTMWEVIEHLPDPRAVMSEIVRVLRPGGYLAFSTPDSGSLVARVWGKRWLGWRKVPEHLFYFDLKSITTLLQHFHLRVVDHRFVSITVTAEFGIHRLAELFGVRPPRLPSRVGRAAVKINPLYDLFVLAQLQISEAA